VAVVYRWAENQLDRLPELATELVRQQVTVIAPPTTSCALAVKALTTTIPIVFLTPEDPVRFGLVASLARPGGNLTGVNLFTGELSAKRLEILRDMVPGATHVAVLVNPTNPATETTVRHNKWLVVAIVPGVERQPLKKLNVDEEALLKLLHRWGNEAGQAGRQIKRIVVAYEAGRDGFWLARWLRGRDVETYVIHPASVAVSREHRRAKTDRLDTELLMRALLGWLRGEKRRCSMVAIPTVEEEDARRPNRERGNLITEQTRIVNQIKAILARFGIRTFGRFYARSRKSSNICARRKGRRCLRTRARSCAATSRGYASCASRSARSSRDACANSRRPR
jgi:ABC transporter substrate binding protein/Transposase